MLRRCLLVFLALDCGPVVAQDVASYPMLMAIQPLAAQVGTTAEFVVDSRYTMAGAYQVFVSGTGVQGEVGSAVSDKPPITKLRVRFTVAPGAQLGPREFRIATPQGISTAGQLVVVRDPVLVENDKSGTASTAQLVDLPASLCGTISKAEESDFYRFYATAGQALTFQVRAARCEDKIHDLQVHFDPLIVLRDSRGTVIAGNDNYFFADPLLQYTFKTAGLYTLEIRDVRYQGNVYWRYVIEAHGRPLVTNVFPLAVRAETRTSVELIGYNLPKDRRDSINLPGDSALGLRWLDLSVGNRPPMPVPVVVTSLPTVFASDEAVTTAAAQQLDVPCGVNGRLATPGAAHYFAFDAKKGERFSFETIARRHESALDPVLTILNEKGVRLIENDDFTRHRVTVSDSQIENWAAPADGRYVIEVRDALNRGGPEFVYFLQATRAEPYFLLDIDCDKCVVSPGGYATIFVRAARRNGLTGEIQLAIEGLPPGVEATCGRILDGADDGIITIHADSAGRPRTLGARVTGTLTNTTDNKPKTYTAVAQPWQETYLPGGGRGLWPMDSFYVSVAAPLDILSVKIEPTEITLPPGGSQRVAVTIERAPGFNKNVSLDVMYRHLGGVSGNCLPPGVTLDEKASKTVLNGDALTGSIVLTAAKDAKPAVRQQVPVLAHLAINFVMKMSYSAPPLLVTVAPAAEE